MGWWQHRGAQIGAAVAGVFALLLVVAAAFPWGVLKGTIERHLSARFGRPVTIARMERVDGFGFTPTLRVDDVRVPQADWAGGGDFARIAHAQATFSLWPLLAGRFAPHDVRLRGLRLAFVRAADGRDNWSRPGDRRRGGNDAVALSSLTIADSVIDYRDDKEQRHLTARFTADPVHGLVARGSGTVRGTPVSLSLLGPPVGNAAQPWPFTVSLAGPALAMTAKGTMDRPLDTDRMTLDVTARASDLKLIDAVIEAGLIHTQPVRLAAHVRHDAPDWTITGLHGTVGGSDLAGTLTVKKRDGRTKLDGDVSARQLAFDDFADAAERARAAALEQQVGLKLVPDTRVNLAKIDQTDGRIGFRILHLFSHGRPSSLQAAHGTLVLDHQTLTVAPFALDLTRGTISGRVVVAQGGRPVPTVSLDLWLRGSTIETLAGGGGSFTGSVTGHARLKGRGSTIREAVGHSDGSVGFVARDGTLPERTAAALGFDAMRALLAGHDQQAGLRCVVLHLAVAGGRGRVSPLVIDTTQSQLHGQGSITFPAEALAITLTGAPKHGTLLRLPGSATMTGTIREPHVTVPPEVKSVGNIFKAIGRAITGRQGPEASDANCGALAVAALH